MYSRYSRKKQENDGIGNILSLPQRHYQTNGRNITDSVLFLLCFLTSRIQDVIFRNLFYFILNQNRVKYSVTVRYFTNPEV